MRLKYEPASEPLHISAMPKPEPRTGFHVVELVVVGAAAAGYLSLPHLPGPTLTHKPYTLILSQPRCQLTPYASTYAAYVYAGGQTRDVGGPRGHVLHLPPPRHHFGLPVQVPGGV